MLRGMGHRGRVVSMRVSMKSNPALPGGILRGYGKYIHVCWIRNSIRISIQIDNVHFFLLFHTFQWD
jgi:hypothetical protein